MKEHRSRTGPTSFPLRTIARSASAFGVGLALVVAVACGGGTPAELSNELVQKGLRVQGDGKNAEAARLYREALVHNADNKFAYYNLGVIDQGAGRIRAAEYKYRLALEVDPRFQAALFNLGTVLSRSNPEAAVRVYENLVELQPDNAGAHLNLGFVLRGLGRGDEADREFDRAVALDPSLRERVESGEGD